MVQRIHPSVYSIRSLVLGGAVALAMAGCQTAQPMQGRQADSASVLAQKGAATEPSSLPEVDPAKTLEDRAKEYADAVKQAYNQPQGAENSQTPPLAIAQGQKPPAGGQNGAKPEPSAVNWMPAGSGQGASGGLLGAALAPKAQAMAEQKPVTPQVVPLARPVIESNSPSTANQAIAISDNTPAADHDNAIPANAIKPPSDALPALNISGNDALEGQVTQRLRDNSKEAWAQLDYQMLQFIQDQPVPRQDVLSSLPSEDRQMLSTVMDGLSNFRTALRADNNMLPSKKVRPLLEMADRLRAQSELSIPTLSLCTRVDGFGVYEPIDSAKFVAGAEHVALIYCEVENFASEIDEQKMWATRLSQEAVLYTETGMAVWQDKSKVMTDLSRNRRHDFYIVKKIHLPANLTIGRYLLKVTIVDQEANRVAEATLPMSIVAQQP